jgi:triosephosphate isomerase
MKKAFIVANWKSNKTLKEVRSWFGAIRQFSIPEGKEIIICAPFIFLSEIRAIIRSNNLSIKLGVQNISSFGQGAHTGEICAEQVADFATHAIIGHSERRRYFHETDNDVIAKLKQLVKNNITPILCISDIKQMDYYLSKDTIILDKAEDIIFVYEPPSAISEGGQFHADSPEIANQNAGQISQKIGKKVTILYGGSVNSGNAGSFFTLDNIDGCLVGQASLDAKEFYKIIQNA